MLDKQVIPHFKFLVIDSEISQEQPFSSIRDDHATLLVKITLSKEELRDSL